ncbi:serine hydrolase [Salinimonas lutimaris]|uniref:serine hydrolase n=1 Tax=Salinimonas lutimaris TaxID=914153 RepID=UPI0010BFDE2E|nr:serine hydrolase [Salinimonas lutimaris]
MLLSRLCGALVVFCGTLSGVCAQPVNHLPDSLSTLPQVIDDALATFNTPGMAVGIVVDGKTLYAAGHGLRDVDQDLPVNTTTWFRLASTSKAFTGLAMAQLVSEGKISWNDKVVDHLPEFALSDPWVTHEFRIRDLFIHQSGLAGAAGDLMLWPAPSTFTTREIIHNLRYLQPVHSFRTQFAYSNVMYLVAGEIIARKRQSTYAEALQEHVFSKLDMQCYGSGVDDAVLNNAAVSYSYKTQTGFTAVSRNRISAGPVNYDAAGAVTCNLDSMLKWLAFWENDTQQLVSKKQKQWLVRQQVALPVSDLDEAWNDTQFSGYAIGWRVGDINGRKVVSHTGTVSGYQTYVAFIPSLKVGAVIMNNGSHYGARGAVMQTILKHYLAPDEQRDWVASFKGFADDRDKRWNKRHHPATGSGETGRPADAYTGTYVDVAMGKMTITQREDGLYIASEKMPALTGKLTALDKDAFSVTWDKGAESPVILTFTDNSHHSVDRFTVSPFILPADKHHAWKDFLFKKYN